MDKDNESNMLDEIRKIAKKHGYTVTDVSIDPPRFEVGMNRDTEEK